MRRGPSRSPVPALVALVLAGAGAAAQEFRLEVVAAAEEVGFGARFPLSVVSTWDATLAPEPFDDRELAPLVVRLAATRRSEDGGVVTETRVYDAFAFRPEIVTIPALTVRARPRDGGPPREATSRQLQIRVRSSLDAADPGPVELPGDLLPVPARRGRGPWIVATAVAILAGLGAGRFLRTRLRRAGEGVPPEDPSVRALARIASLRAAATGAALPAAAFCVEASALVRDYLEARFGIRAPGMTTEEFLAAPGTAQSLRPGHREVLADFLSRCDLVKFARRTAAAGDRERLLEAAERVVRESAPAAAASGSAGP